ncbi:hypothetical protein [Massilia sp. DWR3-1-1]|uniref:hypothetical protein n=1 Tax=Massilia sp. DWR3-1-1 TaxID=2804559 RepID=UPI003CE90E65
MPALFAPKAAQTRPPMLTALIKVFGVTALLLLIPMAAMQLSEEVRWGIGDFAAAAALLAATGSAYVIAARYLASARARMLAGGALAVVMLVVWAELAVGLLR